MATLTRRDFAKLTGATAATLSLGGLLASCASGEAEKPAEGATEGAADKASSQVIVSMTTGSEPAAGFDPMVSWGCGEHVHEPLIQSTLITTDADLNFKNDLATSYEASEDGMTWTFTVRDDVKFTDGTPLTARDVAFTINGILNSEASECDMSMVKEAVATDDATVVVHMEKPFNALLYTLAVVGIVPEHAYGDTYGDNPIGSGRYMLEQWDKGQQVILKANPDYYGEAPNIQRVVVVFMEEDASLAAAKSGQVDVAYTSATFAAQQPSGYDLLNCASVDSRGISLPVIPAGAMKTDEKGEAAAGQRCHVRPGHSPSHQLRRRPRQDDRQRAERLRHRGLQRGRRHAVVLARHEVLHRCREGEEAARRRRLDGRCGRHPREGRHARCVQPVLLGRRHRAPRYRRGVHQPDERAGHRSIHQGRQLGRSVPASVYRSGGVGLGHERAHRDLQPVLLQGHGQLRLLQRAKPPTSTSTRRWPSLLWQESFDLWKKAQWDGQSGIAPQGDAPWVWFANIDHLYFAKDNLKIAKQKPHPHGHGWSLVNNVDQWSWA